MSKKPHEKTPEDILKERDKDDRIKREESVLADAQRLTNGEAADPQTNGRVLQWVVERLIEMETLLRASIEHTSKCQLIENCIATHAQKKWVVRVFGMAYAMPVTVAIIIIGVLTYLAMLKQGWV